jgi:hypothetical protein
MGETDAVKIGRLEERMKTVEGKLDQAITKLDAVLEGLAEKYATKEELAMVEKKAVRFVWITNLITAVASPLLVFLIIDFLKNK